MVNTSDSIRLIEDSVIHLSVLLVLIRLFEKTMKLKVLGIDLPKQEITYTQWFHADCIASYYKYEIFSD